MTEQKEKLLKLEDKMFIPHIFKKNLTGKLLIAKFYLILIVFSYTLYLSVSYLFNNYEALDIKDIVILTTLITLSLYPILVINSNVYLKFLFLLFNRKKIIMLKYVHYIENIKSEVLIENLLNNDITKENKQIIEAILFVRAVKEVVNKD